jgi:hypothetical protein
LRKNLDLSFKSTQCLVYYLDSTLYVDTSTSKTSVLAAPAGIAGGSPAWKTRQRYEVSTFLIVDPIDDLGAPSTPEVLRFRAGS